MIKILIFYQRLICMYDIEFHKSSTYKGLQMQIISISICIFIYKDMSIFTTVAQSVYFKPQSLYTSPKLFTSPNSSKNDFKTPNLKCKVPRLIKIERNKYISENINHLDIISSQSLGRQ